MLDLLIITSGPLCCNPRPGKEALALAAAGHAVTVLSVFETQERARMDAQLLASTSVRQIAVRLPSRGARYLLGRLQRWMAYRTVRYTPWQPVRALGPARMLLAHARRLSADLTIVHNEAPFWVGRQLLAAGRAVAADFEDWYSEDLLPVARRYRPLRLLRALEGDLLRSAAYTTTTSYALAAALHRVYGGRRPCVVTNSFPLQPLAPERPPSAIPAFFWFSQTVGPGRGLEAFVRAWAATRHPSRLVLLGEPAPGFRGQLLAALPPARHPQLEFLASVSPQELPAVIARHDLGLALELGAPPSRDLTITNKILQYLNAGLPVVASDTAGQREVLAHAPQAGMLVRLEDTGLLTQSLDALLATPERFAPMRTAARQAVEQCYCWEIEARTLVELVARATRRES
jgi:glycosyltransferase involved in cell wall biosynthesis